MSLRFLSVLALATLPASVATAERLTEAPLVDAAWLAGVIDHPDLLVIDVRDLVDGRDVFAEGHIPGAVSAPYGTYGWRQEVDGVPGQLPPVDAIAARIGALGVGPETHVVIVSQGSDSSEFGKATRVFWTFSVLGHDAVSILDGGQAAWLAAGGAVETGTVEPEPAVFAANFRPELIATTDEVQSALDAGVTLVDGRPAAQYRGEQQAPVARVAGTIPGAVNLEQSRFFDGAFASAENISLMTEEIGLAGDEEAIAFCNTGHWASIVWFGLAAVGGNDNIAMYDGSMAEWTRDEARPVQ